jgi:hypothetical protein
MIRSSKSGARRPRSGSSDRRQGEPARVSGLSGSSASSALISLKSLFRGEKHMQKLCIGYDINQDKVGNARKLSWRLQ